MKKKWVVCLVSVVVVLAGLLFYVNDTPKGDTIESQQKILNKALPSGRNWTIYNAAYIDGYKISSAYSSNNKSAIVIFEPTDHGGYKLISSKVEDSEHIIVYGVMINGKWYDLVWFNGAKTEYALVTHTVNGIKREPLKFDTHAMQLIVVPMDETSYSWDVVYYDGTGQQYTR